jgi:RNA polymerase sigma-70 factor, ECF subfamily
MNSPFPMRSFDFTSSYVDALSQGDPETEFHFFCYFRPLVERRLRQRLPSPQQVQDATQETFARVLEVVRSRRGVRHPERFGAFVYALCGNVAREICREERRFIRLEDFGADAPARCSIGAKSLTASETYLMVRQVLARMPVFDRRLLQAVFLDEEEKPQLCRRFGVTQSHLHVLVYRAKRRFMAHLQRRGLNTARQKNGCRVLPT